MEIKQLGPYRIGPKLGKGGMGSVYEATDVKTGQRVAVKALAPQLAAAEGFRERFEAEIDSLKKLQHDGIVRLYGYGEDGGVLFYSMEVVDGPSLEQELNAGRRFDWNETLGIAIQICRALKHAHDHGVVHRDIKPANLLLAKGDKVKIADFGIARLFGATALTTAGGILGTADYMSPEQVDGRPVTDRCDQYALGCVMFALLAGRPPFRAKTMPEMLQLQRYAEPEPVRRYAPQTPEQLDRLINQLLSKDPAERFPNVLVLGRHMEAMQRALSRPAKPREDAVPAISLALNQGTAAPATDVTLAQDLEPLQRLETTDSGVYDAPTLADDGQAPASAAGAASRPGDAEAASRKQPVTAPPRFTIVDEAAERSRTEAAERWTIALQLVALAATVAVLAWVTWRLTRPSTADELFTAMQESLAETGGDPKNIGAQVAEFLEQYPADARVAQVQTYADELELQKLARQLRMQSRLPGDGGAHPAEQVYADALALIDADPARAAEMLTDLLVLYPPAHESDGSVKRYLVLAERQLDKLRDQLEQTASQQLPRLKERLEAARRLEASAPERAAGMYRAIVRLYGEVSWAAPVVEEAKRRLGER